MNSQTYAQSLKERLDQLQEQILCNLINRGLIIEEDEGKANAELSVFRYHIVRITLEALQSMFVDLSGELPEKIRA